MEREETERNSDSGRSLQLNHHDKNPTRAIQEIYRN